jgi:hypothetical protein
MSQRPAKAIATSQNKKGLIEIDIFPSVVRSILKSTCFSAVVSPTITYNSPLQVSVPVDLFI